MIVTCMCVSPWECSIVIVETYISRIKVTINNNLGYFHIVMVNYHFCNVFFLCDCSHYTLTATSITLQRECFILYVTHINIRHDITFRTLFTEVNMDSTCLRVYFEVVL